MLGIWLVIHPDFKNINFGDFLGLLSGIISGFSVVALRLARKYDSTTLVLFYVMAIGTVLNFVVMIPFFKIPHGWVAVNLIVAALFGVLGQIFFTEGYRFITARAGGLVSTARIVFAIVLGVTIFSDNLTFQILAGASLIIASLIGVGVVEKRQSS